MREYSLASRVALDARYRPQRLAAVEEAVAVLETPGRGEPLAAGVELGANTVCQAIPATHRHGLAARLAEKPALAARLVAETAVWPMWSAASCAHRA